MIHTHFVQGCEVQLGSATGKDCYPLEDIPFCLDCHKKRIT